MTVCLALDTAVFVAAVMGDADLWWRDWLEFDEREKGPRILPKRAFEEYEQVVEGMGRSEPGVLETLIADASTLIRATGSTPPTDKSVRMLGFPGNRKNRLLRMLALLPDPTSGSWNPSDALARIRRLEADTFVRKREFLERQMIFTPSDTIASEELVATIAALIPTGGISWRFDSRILAEASQHRAESGTETEFVTQDRTHMGPHAAKILECTDLLRIRDLKGQPF